MQAGPLRQLLLGESVCVAVSCNGRAETLEDFRSICGHITREPRDVTIGLQTMSNSGVASEH